MSEWTLLLSLQPLHWHPVRVEKIHTRNTAQRKTKAIPFCSLRCLVLYLLQSAYLLPFFMVGLVPSFRATLSSSHCTMWIVALRVTSQPWRGAEARSFRGWSALAFLQASRAFHWSTARSSSAHGRALSSRVPSQDTSLHVYIDITFMGFCFNWWWLFLF